MRRLKYLCRCSVLLSCTVGVAPAHSMPAPDSLRGRPWYVPDHAGGQVAGGQGMVAAGAGYRLGLRWEVELVAGYVPGRHSITPMGIFTAKATYMPWAVSRRAWTLQPLAVGMHVNYTASRGLNASRDNKYPTGYYWWSARTRLGAFLGGRLAYAVPSRSGRLRRAISLYYELGTNDLYLVSWWANPRALSVVDLATLGLGLKVDL